jgi:hypothetical protein
MTAKRACNSPQASLSGLSVNALAPIPVISPVCRMRFPSRSAEDRISFGGSIREHSGGNTNILDQKAFEVQKELALRGGGDTLELS